MVLQEVKDRFGLWRLGHKGLSLCQHLLVTTLGGTLGTCVKDVIDLSSERLDLGMRFGIRCPIHLFDVLVRVLQGTRDAPFYHASEGKVNAVISGGLPTSKGEAFLAPSWQSLAVYKKDDTHHENSLVECLAPILTRVGNHQGDFYLYKLPHNCFSPLGVSSATRFGTSRKCSKVNECTLRQW